MVCHTLIGYQPLTLFGNREILRLSLFVKSSCVMYVAVGFIESEFVNDNLGIRGVSSLVDLILIDGQSHGFAKCVISGGCR